MLLLAVIFSLNNLSVFCKITKCEIETFTVNRIREAYAMQRMNNDNKQCESEEVEERKKRIAFRICLVRFKIDMNVCTVHEHVSVCGGTHDRRIYAGSRFFSIARMRTHTNSIAHRHRNFLIAHTVH